MDGWSKLGAALGGNSEAAYQQGEFRGATVAHALAEARIARSKQLGIESAAKRAYAGGNNELGDALMRGETLQSTTEGLLHKQGLGWGDEAWKAATAPNADMELINRMNIVRDGKPVDLTKIEGNVSVNPTLTPQHQALAPTGIGLAEMMAHSAQARASDASAASSYANATRSRAGIYADRAANYDLLPNEHGNLIRVNKLTGETAPVMIGDAPMIADGKGRGAASAPSALTSQEIRAMFTMPNDTIDNSEYRRFLEFQRVHDIPNAQLAAQMFSTDMSNVLGGADLPKKKKIEKEGTFGSLLDAFRGNDGESAVPIDPTSQKTAADAATPGSQAEFDALASGTLFVNPSDGRLLRKK